MSDVIRDSVQEASLDQPNAIKAGAELQTDELGRYLYAHQLGILLDVKQFGRGYSNLTYLLRTDHEGTVRELILRAPPRGVKIASAHDVGREFRILDALSHHWSKAPKTIAYCIDDTILGVPFYLMERTQGVILRARGPKSLPLATLDGAHLSTTLIDTLAEIHSIDIATAGLSDLGKPDGYNARQVKGWGERYAKAKTDEVPDVETILSWLTDHTPKESGVALLHNDFKYDNVIFTPDLAHIGAVLDWEMSTLGDPLMDLGTTLGYWVQANDPPLFQAMRFGPTDAPNSLTRMQLVDRYAEKSGRPVTNLVFYFGFALFKLAVVAQQLYQRFTKGLTTEPRYALMIEGVRGLTRVAVEAVERDRIDVLGE